MNFNLDEWNERVGMKEEELNATKVENLSVEYLKWKGFDSLTDVSYGPWIKAALSYKELL